MTIKGREWVDKRQAIIVKINLGKASTFPGECWRSWIRQKFGLFLLLFFLIFAFSSYIVWQSSVSFNINICLDNKLVGTLSIGIRGNRIEVWWFGAKILCSVQQSHHHGFLAGRIDSEDSWTWCSIWCLGGVCVWHSMAYDEKSERESWWSNVSLPHSQLI